MDGFVAVTSTSQSFAPLPRLPHNIQFSTECPPRFIVWSVPERVGLHSSDQLVSVSEMRWQVCLRPHHFVVSLNKTLYYSTCSSRVGFLIMHRLLLGINCPSTERRYEFLTPQKPGQSLAI